MPEGLLALIVNRMIRNMNEWDNEPDRVVEPEDFLAENCGFCGCGSPEEAAQWLLNLLELMPLFEKNHAEALEALIPTPGQYWFTLYMLDKLDLINHGTSIRGAWLTPKGETTLKFLRQQLDNDQSTNLANQSKRYG
jgi:hypothetical protein